MFLLQNGLGNLAWDGRLIILTSKPTENGFYLIAFYLVAGFLGVNERGIGATEWRERDSSHYNYMVILTSPCVSWDFLDKRNIFQV